VLFRSPQNPKTPIYWKTIVNIRFKSYYNKIKSQMEKAAQSTALAPWQAVKLEEEKSKLEGKLGETRETLNVHT
jgi:hypothetical protein